MLEWTAAGDGLRFMGLVHHTDAEREYAYDRNSKVGKLDKALDKATAKGRSVADMKNDCPRLNVRFWHLADISGRLGACPLSWVKRTSPTPVPTSAYDP
jgi:hypothetical protein